MSFTIFQNEKTPFQAVKTRSLRRRKIDIFPKRLTHGFGSKKPFFLPFFRSYRPGKCLLRYSRRKKRLSSLQKQEVKKRRKIDILEKRLTHGFGPKMANFPTLFFLGNIGEENVFYNILKQKKTPFQAIKTRSSKSRKIDIFLKGLTHGLGPKMAIFRTFIFQAKQDRKMSFTIF